MRILVVEDEALLARQVASALTAMVDRYCYLTYVFDTPAKVPSPDDTAELLTALWADAVGLRD